MTISPGLDLIFNLEVFAFIGLMVWLYFKDFSGEATKEKKPEERNDGRS